MDGFSLTLAVGSMALAAPAGALGVGSGGGVDLGAVVWLARIGGVTTDLPGDLKARRPERMPVSWPIRLVARFSNPAQKLITSPLRLDA